MLVLEHAQGHLGQDNHDNQEHANSRADKDAVTATAAKVRKKKKNKLFKLKNNKVLVKLPVRGGTTAVEAAMQIKRKCCDFLVGCMALHALRNEGEQRRQHTHRGTHTQRERGTQAQF